MSISLFANTHTQIGPLKSLGLSVIGTHCLSYFHLRAKVNFEELARCTDDFNGAMLKAVCVEAVSVQVRRIFFSIINTVLYILYEESQYSRMHCLYVICYASTTFIVVYRTHFRYSEKFLIAYHSRPSRFLLVLSFFDKV